MTTKRIEWIDIAKGITILLVIIGHNIKGVLFDIIFSFHMPLFFILSCITYKLANNKDEFIKNLKKSFIYLFGTALAMYIIHSLIQIIIDWSFIISLSPKRIGFYFWDLLRIFILGSGAPFDTGKEIIAPLGLPWFLIVLFLGRTLFDLLHLTIKNKKVFYTIIFLCSVIGVIMSRIQWLPLSFDIALSIQPFFLFGERLKTYNIEKNAKKTIIQSLIIWLTIFLVIKIGTSTCLEIAIRRYPLYPLCFISAIGGTLTVSCFSQLISKFKKICVPIKYLGRNTVIMLWVHYFDELYKPYISLFSNQYLNVLTILLIDIIIFIILMFIVEKTRKNKKTNLQS